MATTVVCAKLGEELPAIDPDSPKGSRGLRMVKLIAGEEMMNRVRDGVSDKAFEMWNDHMLMCLNEFRLDPTSDEANQLLAKQMNAFFFGDSPDIPNFVAPK